MEWTKQHWRNEDMIAYNFRMYLEWARVWSEDRQKKFGGGYVYDEKDEVQMIAGEWAELGKGVGGREWGG